MPKMQRLQEAVNGKHNLKNIHCSIVHFILTHEKERSSRRRNTALLEPGPVILITTAWKDQTNIMTMAWQTVLEFTPSLIGLMISSGSHTFELLKKSKECVINIPTAGMIDTIINIGTSTGASIGKFSEFGLTKTTSF